MENALRISQPNFSNISNNSADGAIGPRNNMADTDDVNILMIEFISVSHQFPARD